MELSPPRTRATLVALSVVFLCSVLSARPAAAVCGDGVVDQNEECDPSALDCPEFENGLGGCDLFLNGDPALSSCTTGTDCFGAFSCCKFNCQFVGSGAPCQDGNECTVDSQCDQVGVCQGGTPTAAGTSCGDPGGTSCDLPDSCDGAGSCLSNQLAAGTVCRAGSGDPNASGVVCDPEETCPGGGADCPADVLMPAGTTCRDSADLCDAAETCSGVNGEPCGPQAVATAGTECRPSTDGCDPAEVCDGTSQACPPDEMLGDGVICDDGDRCTLAGLCADGICQAGPSVLAGKAARFGRGAVVQTDVIVNDVKGRALFQKNSMMVDGTLVSAPVVKLARGASVFDVAADAIVNRRGEIRGTTSPTPVSAPVPCPTASYACGGPSVLVGYAETLALPPGSYDDVRVRKDGTLLLEEGDYEFCLLKVSRNGVLSIQATDPSRGAVLKVEKVFQAGENVTFLPAPGADTPTVYAHKISWGANGNVFAHMFSDGLLKFGRATVFDGTSCASVLRGNPNTVLGCTSEP